MRRFSIEMKYWKNEGTLQVLNLKYSIFKTLYRLALLKFGCISNWFSLESLKIISKRAFRTSHSDKRLEKLDEPHDLPVHSRNHPLLSQKFWRVQNSTKVNPLCPIETFRSRISLVPPEKATHPLQWTPGVPQLFHDSKSAKTILVRSTQNWCFPRPYITVHRIYIFIQDRSRLYRFSLVYYHLVQYEIDNEKIKSTCGHAVNQSPNLRCDC